MKEISTKKKLLSHCFLGSFDQGVMLIFLSFYIWGETDRMGAIAIAFIIPVIVNTVVDFIFSNWSDRGNRILFMIIGNIGSALFLACYGLMDNLSLLYIFIFLKSFFSRIYLTSLQPFRRETIPEGEFRSFIARENYLFSLGASIGGFALIYFYRLTENLTWVFMVAGAIELLSTVPLFLLKKPSVPLRKSKEEEPDRQVLKSFTWIYSMEAFAIALLVNRFIIFLKDVHHYPLDMVGIVFFVVYGVSNLLAARIYHWFQKIPLKRMLILSFFMQALFLVLMMYLKNIRSLITLWFLFELLSGVVQIYSEDHMYKSLFSRIGRRLSFFRISVALATIAGQWLVSRIWDFYGMKYSFFVSAGVLLVLALGVIPRLKLSARSKKVSMGDEVEVG